MAEIDQAVALLSDSLLAPIVNVCTALTNLERVRGSLHRYLFLTGSYALGVWRHGDAVRLVCMTETSEALFWEYVAERLNLKETKNLASRNIMELSSPTFSRAVDGSPSILAQFAKLSSKGEAGCKFYLHYCVVPANFDPSSMEYAMLPAYNSTYDINGQRSNFNTIRDMQQLGIDIVRLHQSSNSSAISTFGKAYDALRDWAENNGIFGSRFGYLNDESLIWVVHGAYGEFSSPQAHRLAEEDETSLMKAVFKQFNMLLRDTFFYGGSEDIKFEIVSATGYRMSDQLTAEANDAIYEALQIKKASENMDSNIAATSNSGFRHFLDSFDRFYIVTCGCWAVKPTDQANFEEDVFTENVNMILKYFRSYQRNAELGGLSLRLWPNPITNTSDNSLRIYAIGLRRHPSAQYAAESIDECAGRLATHIEQNVLAYDDRAGIINITVVNKHAFEPCLENEADHEIATYECESPSTPWASREQINSGRFRTAHQAINRLRHDPAHAAIEYDLGYEDRFDGIVWMALEQWGGKQTEEEDCIPEHRVRQLKRREDGVVVWDREKRVDLTDW